MLMHAMDWESTEPSLSFVIRLWREETGNQPRETVWRAQITNVPSGERRYFQDIASLNRFFATYLNFNMASVFSFVEPIEEPEGRTEATPEDAMAGVEGSARVLRTAAASLEALPVTLPLTNVLTSMIAQLQTATGLNVPDPANPLPWAAVSLLSVEERVVGLGSFRGQANRRGFGPISLKGGRLLAGVRFDVLAESQADVVTQSMVVHSNLLGLRGRPLPPPPALPSAIFLRMKASSSSMPEQTTSPAGWRKTLIYEVLYEYHFEDTDGAEGLIARIPIHTDSETLDSPDRETSVVSNALVRWDEQTAPTLEVRGVASIQRLSTLVFLPGVLPSGGVELLRNTAAATASPMEFVSLETFLEAVIDPVNPILSARFVFPSLNEFLNSMTADPNMVMFGDWNIDGAQDAYMARSLELVHPLRLRRSIDRFSITYDPGNDDPRFNLPGIVYVRAG